MQKLITFLTVGLFIVLTGLSFVLSFDALVITAAANGKEGFRAYIWPLLIDGGLILFSLSVLYAHLRNESIILQWGWVGVFTIATITFNYVQAPNGIIAKAVAVTAPIVLVLTFERLMSMLRSGVQRSDYLSNLNTLQGESSQKQDEIEHLKAKVSRLKKQEKQLETTSIGTRQQRLLDILASGETNKTRIAEQLDVARSTVYNDIEVLSQQGLLQKNGQPH